MFIWPTMGVFLQQIRVDGNQRNFSLIIIIFFFNLPLSFIGFGWRVGKECMSRRFASIMNGIIYTRWLTRSRYEPLVIWQKHHLLLFSHAERRRPRQWVSGPQRDRVTQRQGVPEMSWKKWTKWGKEGIWGVLSAACFLSCLHLLCQLLLL